jgi:hypothetical protein
MFSMIAYNSYLRKTKDLGNIEAQGQSHTCSGLFTNLRLIARSLINQIRIKPCEGRMFFYLS